MERTSRFICTLLLSSLIAIPACAKTSKYRVEQEMPPAKVLNGMGVGVDMVGFGMMLTNARFANMEVNGRLNILEKYFPVVELGIGQCDREGNEQATKFHTRAPYFRVGGDYNLTKKRNGNRLFVGLRYAFSSFNYDYSNPDFGDVVYDDHTPLQIEDMDGKMHWLEINVGVETKLWSFVRLGWNLRYKARLSNSFDERGEPWYTPGFGKNGGTTWGGMVNVMFDLDSFIFKKNKKKNL